MIDERALTDEGRRPDPDPQPWLPGERADWWHIPRGGWGMVNHVYVRIDEIRGEKARVIARLARGGEKKVWVKLTSLHRLTPEQIAAEEERIAQSNGIQKAAPQ